MRKSREEIRRANKKYYFDDYAKTISRRYLKPSFFFIFVLSALAIGLEIGFERIWYYKEASRIMLTEEVSVWVEQQIKRNIFNPAIITIVLIAAALIIWLIPFWKKVKSYEIYKKKRLIASVCAGLVAAEIVIVVGNAVSRGTWNAFWEGVLLVLIFLPLLAGSRLFVPWEIVPLAKTEDEDDRQKLESFWIALDFIAKMILKNQ